MTSQAVIRQIAEKVIAAMETAQAADFKKPWITLGAHRNVSGHVYVGINAIATSLSGFSRPRWATFLQIQEKGWRVKKGAKATPIVYWDIKDKPDAEKEGDKFVLQKTSHLFNEEQIEGIPEFEDLKAKKPFEVVEAAEQIVEAMVNDGLRIEHAGDEAYYSPVLDKVTMPEEIRFSDREAYLCVLSHEILHSVGHKKRMARDLSGKRGCPQYAFEEMVAELGSSQIYGLTGLVPSEEQIKSSACYLKGWAEVLRQDPAQILKAASAAQKAVAYIEERLPKPAVEEEVKMGHVVRLTM